MAREGDAYVDFHAQTDHVEGEAERGIKRAAEHLEDGELKKIGKDMGDTMSTSIGDEFERSGPKLGKRIERGLGKTKVRTKVVAEFDRDNNVVRRWVTTVTDEIEEAFSDAGRPGGPLNRVGQGIADAIGSGFNVSGKSPLIVVLIPLVGALIGLILAAVQAVNALVAAFLTLPAVISAVLLQVGVLFLAFKGIGTAVQGAFAAKNAKELNEAIKGLTPSAQAFVKSLLPLKGLFTQLKTLAQENFFKSLGDVIPRIQKALGPTLVSGFGVLAAALGHLFRDLGLFFASPAFVAFIRDVIPATVRWLQNFGPNFITFMTGLIEMSRAILPFLEKLGQMLGGTLFQLGVFFSDLANDPGFQKWLSDMQSTLEDVVELFGALVEFVTVFAAQLNAAGGGELLKVIIDAVQKISFFLASPIGKKAMEGLITVAAGSIVAVASLTIALLSLFALLQTIIDFFHNDFLPMLQAIGQAFVDVFTIAGLKIAEFFTWLGGVILKFLGMGDMALSSFGTRVRGIFAAMGAAISGRWNAILAEVRGIPGRISAALGNLGSLLFNAGRNLIQGLINGIRNMLGPLGSIVSRAANLIGGFFNQSPAKWGPLSGRGDPLYKGQEFIKRLAAGMTMEGPTLRSASTEATSNIVFGPNSIGVNFNGALPTNQQATSTGSAVGSGIMNQLAARNTRLAVRTL
jgi:hypothetical protein